MSRNFQSVFTSGFRFRDLGDDPEYVQGCLDLLWWNCFRIGVLQLWDVGMYRLDQMVPHLVASKFDGADEEGVRLASIFLQREVAARLGCEDGMMRHPERTGLRVNDGYVPVQNTVPWGECEDLERAFECLIGIEGSIMDRAPRSYIAPRDVILGLARTG